jgi:hypothetical protein
MGKRKVRDEADARACVAAAEASGRDLTGWARAEGVDGRSLRAWSMNLGLVARTRRRKHSLRKSEVRLVELVRAPSTAAARRYVVRVGDRTIEVDDGFDESTLRRLLSVVSPC